jgi:hypothetical protein
VAPTLCQTHYSQSQLQKGCDTDGWVLKMSLKGVEDRTLTELPGMGPENCRAELLEERLLCHQQEGVESEAITVPVGSRNTHSAVILGPGRCHQIYCLLYLPSQQQQKVCSALPNPSRLGVGLSTPKSHLESSGQQSAGWEIKTGHLLWRSIVSTFTLSMWPPVGFLPLSLYFYSIS